MLIYITYIPINIPYILYRNGYIFIYIYIHIPQRNKALLFSSEPILQLEKMNQ